MTDDLKTTIYTLGAPRSGTIYLNCLMSALYGSPSVDIVSLGHSYEATRLVIDARSNAPHVVAIRDPYDAISSDILGSMSEHVLTESPHRYIEDVTWLWESILSSDIFFIAPFDVFTKSPTEIVGKLELKHPSLSGLADLTVTNQTLEDILAEHDNRSLGVDTAERRARGHVPRVNQPSKTAVLEMLHSKHYEPRFKYLFDMYSELENRYTDIK